MDGRVYPWARKLRQDCRRRAEGYVTSSYMSPSLGAPVALGMLSRGSQRMGERIRVHHLGTVLEAVVVKAPFVDAAGERLK